MSMRALAFSFASLFVVGLVGCDGSLEPYAADPGATPESPATAVEGVGQGALGTGGTDTGRYYRLKSAISGGNVCLDVEGKSQSNGARVLQWTCSSTGENQRWYARQISSAPEYQLSAKHSAKCLRADGGSSATGARAEQDACGHVTSQTRLVLTRQGTATPPRYQIKVMPANKCFRSPGTTSGQEVTLQTCGTGTNFQWIFEEQGFVAENTGSGTWTAPATIPLIPAAGALLPNGKVLVWSSWKPYRFAGTGSLDQTIMALIDPSNPGAATARTITNTTHNMFCPGIAMLPSGDVFVNGGDDSHTRTTSIYRWQTDSWDRPSAMVESRWYNSSVTLPDGRVFTIGGNRTGGTGRTGTGEIWNGSSWSFQSWASITPLTSGQADSVRAMEHPRLLIAPNGKIFVAGPTNRMQWYDVGKGEITSAGNRGDDEASQNDITVMFDVGKILKAGGNISYDRNIVLSDGSQVAANYSPSSQNSYVIDINSGTAAVTKIAPMKWPRTFGNGVVLANGQVVVAGGLDNGKGFSDDGAIRPAELFDPGSGTWTELSAMDKPRPYHSIALLLPDGRVLVGGGGLCSSSDNCAVNHPDVEILSPPYLFSGPRPGKPAAPDTITTGSSFPVTVSGTVTGFSLVRLTGVTHSTNTDQRFMRLSFSGSGGTYSVQAPANKNIAPPGYYMLFALNGQAPSTQADMVRVQ
jgi:galactose oxidase